MNERQINISRKLTAWADKNSKDWRIICGLSKPRKHDCERIRNVMLKNEYYEIAFIMLCRSYEERYVNFIRKNNSRWRRSIKKIKFNLARRKSKRAFIMKR